MNFIQSIGDKIKHNEPAGEPAQPQQEASQWFAPGYKAGNWAGKYDIQADVTAVHNAMKGVGTRERDLLAVICERPNAYLQDLRAAYKAAHKLDLLTRIRLETSGQHQRMFEALLLTKPELRAVYVNESVKGLGTNELLLVDTLLTCNNAEMDQTKDAYKHHHLIGMQARVDFDTSGTFQKLLDAAMRSSRPEDGVHPEQVEQDLITLFNATEGKTFGCDNKAIIELIEHRSKAHLIHLNEAYKGKSKKGRTFVEELVAKQHGYNEKAFCAYFLGPVHWTAFRLKIEVKGHIKTDWEGLLRSLLMPTEEELKGALRILHDHYHVDLYAVIEHHFFNTEIKEALARYVKYVDTHARDTGERAIGNDNPEFWQDPNCPPFPKGGAEDKYKGHLTRAQKIGIGVAVGVGVAAAIGGGILAYELHKKKEQQQQQQGAAAGQQGH